MSSVRKRLGQLFIVGLRGERLSPEEVSAFKDLPAGGFILFRHNLIEPEQIVRLCRSLWDLGGEHPPFIAIDQEGGRVHRLPSPFTHFPSAALIGQRNDVDLAYRIGRAAAAELSLAGINLNFAPVLDVDSNPRNPIIGDRAFGSDPERVIRFSAATAAGLRDGGIIPCGKHFPGHGDTDQDSHFALPVVDRSPEALRATELPPFVHACRTGIEALMTAHVLYPSLDSKFPATLSRAIVTGLLREQLGYDGVVVSDDLEMKAITDNDRSPLLLPPPRDAGEDRGGGPETTALLAALAGVDVFLYGHKLTAAVNAFELLCSEAERRGEIRAQLENSCHRIVELKRRYLKSFTGVEGKDLVERLGEFKHQQIVKQIQDGP